MRTQLSCLPDLLLPWYEAEKRSLPWREDRVPYHVWLSEVMLQQTRVEAVKGYYTRFLAQLPTISDLAAAPEAQLMKLWEGLGYYSRVRNLQKAARRIMEEYDGVFPQALQDIRSLPGIGDYTAGAIASICFDMRVPAVDGNVLRVVSRFCDYHGCTDDTAVKKEIGQALQSIYPQEAGRFTQALMELGAIVCVPNGAPQCHVCPLSEGCLAKKRRTIDQLPVRAEKKKRKQENLTVFLLTCGDRTAIVRRPDTGLLAGLYEFPNLPGLLSTEDSIKTAEDWALHPYHLEKKVTRKHIFTHIQWNMTGVRMHCRSESPRFLWVTRQQLKKEYALPTAFRQFVEDIWEEKA